MIATRLPSWVRPLRGLVDALSVSLAALFLAGTNSLPGQISLAVPAGMQSRLLYQETNPYVHSGMKSLLDSIAIGGGREAVRPSLRAPRRNIHVALMAASLLTDLLAVCTRLFDCSEFDREIEALSKECLSLSKR